MSKIQNILIPIISSSIFIASCGGGSTESLADLKSQQAELKTQLAEKCSQINMPLFNQTYFDSYFAAADCSDQN